METALFFKFPAALAQVYTDLAKGKLLVCKINHDQVSAVQKLELTKVCLDLFLMLTNPIAPKLSVSNGTAIIEEYI